MNLQTLRIDKLLWYLRLTKSRTLAQAMVATGHLRKNGVRIEKPAESAVAGDVLTFPRGDEVCVLRVLTLPTRRGPPAEARACYEELAS